MRARHCPFCGQERSGDQPYCAQCGRAFPELVAAGQDSPKTASREFARRDQALLATAVVLVLTIAGVVWISLGGPRAGSSVGRGDLDLCAALTRLEAVRDDAVAVGEMGQDGTFDEAERRQILQLAGRMHDEVGGSLGPQLLEMESPDGSRMLAAMRQSAAYYGDGASFMLEAMDPSNDSGYGQLAISALETWHRAGERLIVAQSQRDELEASGRLDC